MLPPGGEFENVMKSPRGHRLGPSLSFTGTGAWINFPALYEYQLCTTLQLGEAGRFKNSRFSEGHPDHVHSATRWGRSSLPSVHEM